MRIAIYGERGNVGSALASEATKRGFEVTALNRDTVWIGDDGEISGDATDASSVAKIAKAHDVVVSALGPSRSPDGDPFEFAGVIAEIARAVGRTRVVIVGGAGSLIGDDGKRLVDSPAFNELFKPEALAHSEALEVLRSAPSGVAWTYISPAPMLVPGPRTGEYVVGIDHPAGESISMSDFAVAVLDEIETPKHERSRFTVASA